MKEIFDLNPFEENPCQIFEAKIFWLPIMYILMCRNIFFPKWGLIGFRLRFIHPDAWYSAVYSYNSYFEDFYQPNWPIHKSRIIKISKTYKPLFWRFLDGFWVVLDGFWAVFVAITVPAELMWGVTQRTHDRYLWRYGDWRLCVCVSVSWGFVEEETDNIFFSDR